MNGSPHVQGAGIKPVPMRFCDAEQNRGKFVIGESSAVPQREGPRAPSIDTRHEFVSDCDSMSALGMENAHDCSGCYQSPEECGI